MTFFELLKSWELEERAQPLCHCQRYDTAYGEERQYVRVCREKSDNGSPPGDWVKFSGSNHRGELPLCLKAQDMISNRDDVVGFRCFVKWNQICYLAEAY